MASRFTRVSDSRVPRSSYMVVATFFRHGHNYITTGGLNLGILREDAKVRNSQRCSRGGAQLRDSRVSFLPSWPYQVDRGSICDSQSVCLCGQFLSGVDLAGSQPSCGNCADSRAGGCV